MAIDKRDYDCAAKLRLMAQDLHEAILAARLSGLSVWWTSDFGNYTGQHKMICPGVEKFEQAHLLISRTHTL